MRIGYDISVLGQGYINYKAKTGVYRVIESLLLELYKQTELELKTIILDGFSNIWDEISANLYIQDNYPHFKKSFQNYHYSRWSLQPLYEYVIKQHHSLQQGDFRNVSLIHKSAFALQLALKKALTFDYYNHFDFKLFDIYHAPFFSTINTKDLQGTPKVLTIYDMIPILKAKAFTSKVRNKFMATINSIDFDKDWVICISENTKQDFCDYTGMSSERVFVTPLAADNRFYPVNNSQDIISTLKRYQIPNTPYLLSLCTLEPRKNLSSLIRCFSKIIADDPTLEINLVLVGTSGWKNADIFQAVKENPILKDKVIFTGYVPDEDLSAIYSGATAFVYPSLYEGFGLPPLEAMQCGTPVITSNTSSLPEVVGDAGIMIDPKQEDELCQALINVINDLHLRANLSRKGIQKASQFSWTKCAKETIQVYQIAASN